MGMTIKLNLKDSENELDKFPTVEAIPKADYEKRLKADLEAILVELQLEIEGKRIDGSFYGEAILDCAELIQQKINSLKEA